MKPDKRVERNTQSILRLRELLREIINNPARFTEDASLREALKSQGGLSKLTVESRRIFSSSLNTVKRIAETALEGGFDALDRLRLGAQEAIAEERTKINRSNKITKIGLRKRINELESTNQQIRQDLLIITHALEKSLAQGRNYAFQAENNSMHALCTREQREIRDMLSLLRNPLTNKEGC
ncbi:MAG: hypothetical protein ACHQYP_10835 [Nitrospiria bacterium]